MKIAQVTGPPLFLTGTGQSRIIPISKELIKRGHTVAIFTPTMHFSGIERTVHEGIPVIKTGQYFVYSSDDSGFASDYRRESGVLRLLAGILTWSLDTIRELRKFKPDIIQLYTTQPNIIILLLLARVLMPFSRICIDYDDLYGGIGGTYDYEGNSKAVILLLGLMERYAHRFAYKASSCSHYFRQYYSIDKIIPNSVDTDLLKRAPAAIDPALIGAIRCKHGIKPSDKVIIAVSRFKELYDYDLLITAAGLLRQKTSGFKVVFIGEGDFKNDLVSMAAKLNLSDLLVFTGWIKDEKLLKHYYYLADICVIPMRDRKLHLARCPIKLLDAISAQLCILAADIGEPAHILQAGVNALFYKAGDSADMADKLFRIISDKELCDKLRGKVKDLIPSYSHRTVASMWEEHFRLPGLPT